MKVAHLTSVHPRYDSRIYHKMCKSLDIAQHKVEMIVADGKNTEICGNIIIHDIGKPHSRLSRLVITTAKVYRKAKLINADIYHLHDPELIFIGLLLKSSGCRVIFDSHEDVSSQILSKNYLYAPIKFILSRMYAMLEHKMCKYFDGVVAATPFIRDKFVANNITAININNFPLISELVPVHEHKDKQLEVCYIGGITIQRGIVEICKAMNIVEGGVMLNLCGAFESRNCEESIKQTKGWSKVQFHGYVDREGVRNILSRSIAGLVTLHPTINYRDALPIKMFEYMSAGVPVIASDFPLWREIVAGCNCGLLVDPRNPNAIAAAINFLISNPIIAKELGANGRRAVEERYNWALEESKLLNFYSDINACNDKRLQAL
jgi:glycosyltransferase involved in cell wall biosynthesis